MIGDGGVGIGWDDASDGLAMWIEAGDGWEGAGGQVDVTVGVKVDRGVSMVGSAEIRHAKDINFDLVFRFLKNLHQVKSL